MHPLTVSVSLPSMSIPALPVSPREVEDRFNAFYWLQATRATVPLAARAMHGICGVTPLTESCLAEQSSPFRISKTARDDYAGRKPVLQDHPPCLKTSILRGR